MNPQLLERLEEKGLEKSTRQKYGEIIEGAGTDDLIGWMREKIDRNTSIGTVLPMRAAVKHYLIAVMGYHPDEVEASLPSATGRLSEMRKPLSTEQLALFHAAVDRVNSASARSLLGLLPLTGLTIGEATGLSLANVRADADVAIALVFENKTKRRVISLPAAGQKLLTAHIHTQRPAHWLFEGPGGLPLTPAAIRKHTRAIAARHPSLGQLCPGVLRATYADLLFRQGKTVPEVQALMGYESPLSAQRHLSTT